MRFVVFGSLDAMRSLHTMASFDGECSSRMQWRGDQPPLMTGLPWRRREGNVLPGLHGLDYAEETISLLMNTGGEKELVGISCLPAQAEQ